MTDTPVLIILKIFHERSEFDKFIYINHDYLCVAAYSGHGYTYSAPITYFNAFFAENLINIIENI